MRTLRCPPRLGRSQAGLLSRHHARPSAATCAQLSCWTRRPRVAVRRCFRSDPHCSRSDRPAGGASRGSAHQRRLCRLPPNQAWQCPPASFGCRYALAVDRRCAGQDHHRPRQQTVKAATRQRYCGAVAGVERTACLHHCSGSNNLENLIRTGTEGRRRALWNDVRPVEKGEEQLPSYLCGGHPEEVPLTAPRSMA